MSILERALRLGEAKQFKAYSKRVERINALEPAVAALDDAQLRARTDEFRARLDKGETLDDLLASDLV